MKAIKRRFLQILLAQHIQRFKRQRTALRAKCQQLRAQHRPVSKRQKELENVTCALLRLGAI